MELWIFLSIAAAFSQNLRFMLQKHLKTTSLTTTGATFLRFLYTAPMVAVAMAFYQQITAQPFPAFGEGFARYVMIGGLGQIGGTLCVVALFAERNFAVGLTFKNTEVILSAVVGFLVLGESLSAYGFGAIVLGLVGLMLLSDPPTGEGAFLRRIFNRASGLGLLSGMSFAISAVAYRGATLLVMSDDFALRAGITLGFVTAFQSLIMAVWLFVRNRDEIARVIRVWRVGIMVGLSSMIGSLCWFSAFTLKTAAYVKGIGQIELLFGFVASYFFYKEKITAREIWGTVILMASIIALILFL